jgi:SPP1 family predicted phage head-tail adaptor
MAVPGAGDLRERVSIQQVSTTRDAMGGEIQSWANLGTFWAQVAPMSAGEQYRRQQVQSSANWKITIRYNAEVTPQMRVRWQGHVFLVKGITNPDARKRFLELACEELAWVPSEATQPSTFDSDVTTFDSTELTWDAA